MDGMGPVLKNPARVPWVSQVDHPVGVAGTGVDPIDTRTIATTGFVAPPTGFVSTTTGVVSMAKASSKGTYQDKDGNYFVIGKGGDLPAGTTFNADPEPVDADEPQTEKRAVDTTVANRMEPGAPENRAVGFAKVSSVTPKKVI